MKTSSRTLIIAVIAVVTVLAAFLFTMQAVSSSQATATPGGLLFVTAPPVSVETSAPVSVSDAPRGVEREIGDVRIMVLQVTRPYDDRLGTDLTDLRLLDSEETIRVDVRVGCIPLQSDCPVDLKDFGLRSSVGDWADLIGPIRLPSVKGLLTTRVVSGNKYMEGGLLYRIRKSAQDLVLYYPFTAGAGDATRFTVTSD